MPFPATAAGAAFFVFAWSKVFRKMWALIFPPERKEEMKKTIAVAAVLVGALVLRSFAVPAPLEGFRYGADAAPAGTEWEDPQALALRLR